MEKRLYYEVLTCLRNDVCRKRSKLWENQTLMLLHDNDSAHTSLLILSYLAQQYTSSVLLTTYTMPDTETKVKTD